MAPPAAPRQVRRRRARGRPEPGNRQSDRRRSAEGDHRHRDAQHPRRSPDIEGGGTDGRPLPPAGFAPGAGPPGPPRRPPAEPGRLGGAAMRGGPGMDPPLALLMAAVRDQGGGRRRGWLGCRSRLAGWKRQDGSAGSRLAALDPSEAPRGRIEPRSRDRAADETSATASLTRSCSSSSRSGLASPMRSPLPLRRRHHGGPSRLDPIVVLGSAPPCNAGQRIGCGEVGSPAMGRSPEGERIPVRRSPWGAAGWPPLPQALGSQTPFWPQVKEAVQVESSSVLGLLFGQRQGEFEGVGGSGDPVGVAAVVHEVAQRRHRDQRAAVVDVAGGLEVADGELEVGAECVVARRPEAVITGHRGRSGQLRSEKVEVSLPMLVMATVPAWVGP